MSRRGRAVRSYSRRRHPSLGIGGAALMFFVLCMLDGGIANAAGLPDGLVGFAALILLVLCWLAAGFGRHY